jgi:predicted DNA-binding protein with PD1-like motif
VFVIRLEDGDVIHEQIEQFAREMGISHAALIIVGGADDGSRIVVGPKEDRAKPIDPVVHVLDGVHEAAGTGTLIPDETGKAVLHMHLACGRGTSSITGCIRTGVKTWHLLEVILFELLDSTAVRVFDPELAYKLLRP